MNVRRFWPILACCFLASCPPLPLLYGEEAETPAAVRRIESLGYVSDSSADMQRCLTRFVWTPQKQEEAEKRLRHLQDRRFIVRQEALDYFEQLPNLPTEFWKDRSEADTLEARLLERRLRQLHSPNRGRRVLRDALETIAHHQLSNLTSECLEALRHFGDRTHQKAARNALRATAVAADSPRLKALLENDSLTLRNAALGGLEGLLSPRGVAALRVRFLQDPEESLRLYNALELADLGYRKSPPALAELLESPNLETRRRAAYALRYLSGRKFGFQAGASPETQPEAIEKWKAWAAADGQTAALNFPIPAPQGIVLFDGETLDDWVEIAYGNKLGKPTNWTPIGGGVLRCQGRVQGYLRTKQMYSNYSLSLEWRMPQGGADSGVGVMTSSRDRSDPECMEVQIHPGNCGDLYLIGGFRARSVNAQGVVGGPINFRQHKYNNSNERQGAAWNRMEIRCSGDNLEIRINGLLQNRAKQMSRDSGHINFRNEGGVVDFRNIVLTPLD